MSLWGETSVSTAPSGDKPLPPVSRLLEPTQNHHGGRTSAPARLPHPATHQPWRHQAPLRPAPSCARRVRPPIPGRAVDSRLRLRGRLAPRGRGPQSARAHRPLLRDWLPPCATVQFSLSLFFFLPSPPPPGPSLRPGFHFRFPVAVAELLDMSAPAAARLGKPSFL